MVSGRIVKYDPAHQLPLAEVRDKVREQVAAAQAAAEARKAGQARLAELKAAPATAMTGTATMVSRAQPHELPPELLDAVLKAPAAPLPAFVGVDLGGQGYAVAKVAKVAGRDPVRADTGQALSQYAQAWGAAEAQAYYTALKSRYDVQIMGAPASTTDDSASGSR
jgi:peptidyl-prolyl cis-trans isomerase D